MPEPRPTGMAHAKKVPDEGVAKRADGPPVGLNSSLFPRPLQLCCEFSASRTE